MKCWVRGGDFDLGPGLGLQNEAIETICHYQVALMNKISNKTEYDFSFFKFMRIFNRLLGIGNK